jgi:hypothetical protein
MALLVRSLLGGNPAVSSTTVRLLRISHSIAAYQSNFFGSR